jgi:(E)-4-hydroxy-3-methylbut-2-enyl-diphosphate synthase
MVDALVEWGKLVAAEGVEAAQQRAEAGAAEEAERDRLALLEEQGDDVNQATEHITQIRRLDLDR